MEGSEQIAQEYEADCGPAKPGYRVVKPELIAFSCITPKNRVLYLKGVIHDGWLTVLRFEYPNAERKVWDPVVKQVAGSLTGATDAAAPK